MAGMHAAQAVRTIAQQRQFESLSKSDQRQVEMGQLSLDGFGSGGFGFSGSGSGAGGSGGGSGATPSGQPSLASLGVTQATMDPWSRYRSQAGDVLAKDMDQSKDPSNIYRSRLEEMMTPGNNFTTNDPSYQWRLDQGQKTVERSLAAKGMLNSGGAAAELQQFGQGAASQEYQAQFGRLMGSLEGVSAQYDKQQQRLMKMAGVDINPNEYGKTVSSYSLGQQQETNDFTLGLAEMNSRERIASLNASSSSSARSAQEDPYNSYGMDPSRLRVLGSSPGGSGSQWEELQARSGLRSGQREAFNNGSAQNSLGFWG